MRKIIFGFFCAVLFFLSYRPVSAEGEFVIDTSIQYDVDQAGKTLVTHTITLENVFTDIYAPSYSVHLRKTSPQNVEAFEGKKKLATEVSEQNDRTTINVSFEDAVVGRGNRRQFAIRYMDDRIVTRTGEVWEASIPQLSDAKAFNDYAVTLLIPQSLGELAYLTPEPKEKSVQAGKNVYTFSKEALVASPVKAAFGRFQVFSFDLTYHLENPLSKTAYIEVALPPDTQFQKVILEKMEPRPDDVYQDVDGNWLAKYILKSRQRVDAKAIGAVQLFSEARGTFTYDAETLQKNLQPTAMWQTNDPAIRELAQRLKEPRAIYDYVVKTLSYDYERAKPNVVRLGASDALKNPKSAICMEFTDLFIAIARAAGIPAREVNGFAYTQNPEVQPLSLVSDVLHAWPEYWDSKSGVWVPIDPTWGSTTGGLDYFSKLDLRHVTFVIHGTDPLRPYPPGSYKLGANPQKDVFVALGQLPASRDALPRFSLHAGRIFPLGDPARIDLVNDGKTALDPQTATVYFDNKMAGTYQFGMLPPLAKEQINVPVPSHYFGFAMPSNMTVTLGAQQRTIPTQKSLVLLANLFVMFILVGLFIFLLSYIQKVRRERIFSFKDFK